MVSDSPGLVDFAIGLVNSVFNLPDGQVIFFEEFEKQKNCEINSALQKAFGLVEMTSGLVNVSFSLPEWQAVKMIFFATCPLFQADCCVSNMSTTRTFFYRCSLQVVPKLSRTVRKLTK